MTFIENAAVKTAAFSRLTTEIPQTGKLPHPREFLFSLSWRQSELSASPRTLPGYGRRHSGSSACRPALRVNTALPRGGRRSDCRCRAFAALPWYQPLSEDLGHEGVHHLGRLPLYIVGDVGVGVQGEAGLGVVQDAGAGLGIHADGQSNRLRFPINNKKSEYPEGYSDGGSVMIGLGKVLSYQWLTGSQQELLSVKLNNLINYFSQSQYNEWLP